VPSAPLTQREHRLVAQRLQQIHLARPDHQVACLELVGIEKPGRLPVDHDRQQHEFTIRSSRLASAKSFTTSPASAWRSEGSFASARIAIWSRTSGTSGFQAEGGWNGSWAILCSTSKTFLPFTR